MLVKIGKYIGFCVYRRSYLLWSPVIIARKPQIKVSLDSPLTAHHSPCCCGCYRSVFSVKMNGNSNNSESRLHGGVIAEERRAQLRVELELIRRRLHDTEGLLQKVDNSLQSRSRTR